jgi:hypothetical protein
MNESERIRVRIEMDSILSSLNNSEQKEVKQILEQIMSLCEKESLSKEIIALTVLLYKQNILKTEI